MLLKKIQLESNITSLCFSQSGSPTWKPYLHKNDNATPPSLPAALPTAITPAINRTASEDLKDSAKNLDLSMLDYTLEETTLPGTDTDKKHGNLKTKTKNRSEPSVKLISASSKLPVKQILASSKLTF